MIDVGLINIQHPKIMLPILLLLLLLLAVVVVLVTLVSPKQLTEADQLSLSIQSSKSEANGLTEFFVSPDKRPTSIIKNQMFSLSRANSPHTVNYRLDYERH